MKKKVLVTGAGGYIGSILVPKLIEKGYAVKAVDRFFFGMDKLERHPELTLIKEDTRWLDEGHFADVYAVIDLVAISNDPSGELFQDATYEINHISRVRTAEIASRYGVSRYILPSSCSIYGFREPEFILDENSPTNPLTTYAKANEKAEQGVLPLASNKFTVTVIRQATVYGFSPRMRFDLAINGMVYGAWENGVIPLMRDGTQWRPMVHVQDTTDAMCVLLESDPDVINGQIFNVGSDTNNYQLKQLAEMIVKVIPKEVQIQWYGDPDHRSYRVNFNKIEKAIGWKAQWTAAEGAMEIYRALETGKLKKTKETITLQWYQELMKWHKIIKDIEQRGMIL